jgi:glucokinase
MEGDNSICTCGNANCLELYATLPMISHRISKELAVYTGYSPAKDILSNGYSLENLEKAASSGDKVILGVLDDISFMTGSALAVMANILNPSLIILGGSVLEAFPMLCDSIYQVIRKRSLLTSYRNLEVKRSVFGWEGGIIGSAARIINMVFSDHT